MVRAYLLIVTISLFSSPIIAQSQLTLYQLNSALPQANQVNASFFPNYKFTLGLPVISSSYVSANGGHASFNRIFSGSGDSDGPEIAVKRGLLQMEGASGFSDLSDLQMQLQ